MVAENVGPDKGCALIQELESYGRQNNISVTLLCNRITVVQAAESRQGLNLAFSPTANCCWPIRWGVLREAQVRSIIMVQVDNLIPIVRSRERSVIRGIRGMGVLSGFMEHLQRVDGPCIAAVWNRTMKLGSSRYRSGCSNRAPVAECTVRRSPRLTAQHCWT
jgi:hypothetical protein